VVEQAKGIIAATRNIAIHEAFEVLRRYARNHNAAIHEVANAVINRGLRP
jgi:AmiR/NasT family two-component response regulator